MKTKYSILIIIVLLAVFLPRPVHAVAAQNFYFVPIEQVGSFRGPEYLCWRGNPIGEPCIVAHFAMMDYGFINNALVLIFDITQADHDALCLNADVLCFPDDIDTPASANAKAFVETVNLPSDWTTPSTTNRELLRRMAGMLQFNQRYGGTVCVGETFLGAGGITLETKWNALSQHQQDCFNNTLTSFGFPSGVQGNPSLRTLIKRGGDLWDGVPFFMGGYQF
jgi:hypothetical protein